MAMPEDGRQQLQNLATWSLAEEFIEAIPDPVVVSSHSGRIQMANRHACSLFGLDRDELSATSLSSLVCLLDGEPLVELPSELAPVLIQRGPGLVRPASLVTSHLSELNASLTVIKSIAGLDQNGSSPDADLLETLSEGVLIATSAGEIVYLNEAARTMLAIDESESSVLRVSELLVEPSITRDPHQRGEVRLQDGLAGRSAISGYPAMLRSTASASVEVSVNAMPLDSSPSGTGSVIVTFQNVTRQKHAELQIAIQKHVLDMIATGNTLDDTGYVIAEYIERVIPGTCCAIYQIERESRKIGMVAAPGVPETIADALSENADDPISALCVHSLVSRQPVIWADASSDHAGDELRSLLLDAGFRSVWCFPVDATAHRSMGVICLYRYQAGTPDAETQALIDTASGLLRVALDRVQIERELRFQSFNDDLTGLPNRVLLMDRIDIALQRAAKSDNLVTLLLINIDRFQMVNNSLGHQAGDELLKELARRLRNCVRSDDLVARFTGDTFGILLEHIATEADAINVVMRIQRAFATPLEIAGVALYISLSIGIALPTTPDDSADTLVRYANIALNRAREAGRGQFTIFSPARDLSQVPKIELQSRLHRALAADALELHFQPVVSLQNRGVTGYESLVRWTDEQFGVVSPDEFLPLAQQSGIMSEITSWVLDRAARQLVDWNGKWGERLFAAVNISPGEMNDSLLVEQVDAVLKRYGIEPSCIVLEMTEHALLDTTGRPRNILDRLRNLGVRIALDDFGTGYSSLSYLEQLNVDAIKIDRTFIQAARGGASRAPVASAMVDLARQLGMQSVAEGIETVEDERVARQLGCDLSQGYLYGRPQPAERILSRPGTPPLTD